MNRNAQLGFGLGLGGGLSDTVVTLVIIGILVAVAVPAYQDYAALARVSEALSSTADVKAAGEKAFAKGPAGMSQSGRAPPGAKHLESMAIARDGTITLVFAESVAPKGQNVVQIVPVSGGGALDLSRAASAGRKFEWQCGGPAGKTTMPEKFRPKNCK